MNTVNNILDNLLEDLYAKLDDLNFIEEEYYYDEEYGECLTEYYYDKIDDQYYEYHYVYDEEFNDYVFDEETY